MALSKLYYITLFSKPPLKNNAFIKNCQSRYTVPKWIFFFNQKMSIQLLSYEDTKSKSIYKIFALMAKTRSTFRSSGYSTVGWTEKQKVLLGFHVSVSSSIVWMWRQGCICVAWFQIQRNASEKNLQKIKYFEFSKLLYF